MKYIKVFKNNSDYEAYKSEGILTPNLTFVKEDRGLYFNPVPKPQDFAGSICLWDNVNNKKVFCLQEELSVEKYPSSQYTPIGVVVIPASHDVYGTGECGIMSLVNMASGTPETGTVSKSYLYWGGYGTDLSLPNLNQVPLISSALTSNEITGVATWGYLPSTNTGYNFTSATTIAGSSMDTIAGYRGYTPFIPSPYLEDGSRNPSYYTTDISKYPGLSANCLSDFDGIGNTQVILSAATGQADWKTASTITNNTGATYYPAACCTWRFHTSGTSQGDWYLPACGEMGYMITRFNEIQISLNKVISIYGSSLVCLLGTNGYYWSSSEYSSSSARSVDVRNGYVDGYTKVNNTYVRAFLRV